MLPNENQTDVVDISQAREKKPNKVQLKRMRDREERRRRLINQGTPENEVDRVMAEQDYRAMPLEKKFELFQATMIESLTRLGEDLQALRDNDGTLAGAMDVNFRAFGKALTKLGIPPEQQQQIVEETEKEIQAEMQTRLDNLEKSRAEAALKAAESPGLKPANIDADGAPIPPPEDATVFGG